MKNGIFFAAACALFWASLGSATARTIRPDDLRRIVGFSSPAISTDGTRVAVVVSKILWNADTYARDQDVVDLATHARRTLTYDRKGLSDPAFSPDSTKLAFVSNVGSADDAKSQIWVMPLDGGDARPVTQAPEGVQQSAWRPDGQAFVVWRAAVSGALVDDWISDYGVADDSDSDRALFHGSPFVGDPAEWRRASAIGYVRDVTTPVLILSDVGDNRDPFATSSMYWRALRDNHKDATLRAWPVDGHFPRDPVRTSDVYEHWIDYIAQHF